MKRNLLLLLAALAMVVIMLASCGGNQECDHTFSENWANNETQHWHPATCEHGEFKDSLANHVDENEDGVCDVCAYDKVGHIHTYAEEWIIEEYYHWHEATCSHTEEQGTYELHSDNNVDAVCDYCGGHVHAMNIIGFCSASDCGKQLKEPSDIDNYDVAYIIYATGITGYNKVTGGTVDYEYNGRSNSGASFEAKTLQNIQYVLGDGYTYTKRYSNSTNAGTNVTDTVEGWYEVDGDGVFGVTSADGGAKFDLVSASLNHLYGYYFALSNFAEAHGAENILYRVFELSQDPSAMNFEYVLDEASGKSSFSYDYLAVTMTHEGPYVNYFEVEVSFTFGEQYALTGLDITLDCYTSDPGVADEEGFLEADVDLDYNEATGEFTLRENAVPDTYTVKVTQTVGNRTAVNPHPKSSFVPESYDIFTDIECTDKIESSVSIKVKTFFKIYLGNYKPEGTTIDKVNEYMRFEILDEDGNVLVSNIDLDNTHFMDVLSTGVISGYYSFDPQTQSRFFVAYPKTAGVYTFRVYFLGDMTHEFKIYAGVTPA